MDGQPSRLCFVGTALLENRNGLVVDDRQTRASDVSEGLAGIDLADAPIPTGGTLAGDPMAREWGSTPPTSSPSSAIGGSPRMSPRTPATPAQIDQGAERRSNIDDRTTRHAG